MRIDLNGLVILLISGTASIDEHGVSIHIGDLRAKPAAYSRTSRRNRGHSHVPNRPGVTPSTNPVS